MSWRLLINISLLCLFLGTCASEERKFDAKFYETPSQDWQRYANKIGIEDSTLSNTVVLMMRSTVCSPCIKELAWWNKNAPTLEGINVKLVVLEKYEKPYEVFLDRQNVSLSSYRDSTFRALTQKLIPTTPFKVYFNASGSLAKLEHMGANGKLKAFVDEINQLKAK